MNDSWQDASIYTTQHDVAVLKKRVDRLERIIDGEDVPKVEESSTNTGAIIGSIFVVIVVVLIIVQTIV